MASDDRIYTWRKLSHPAQDGRSIDIEWRWSGWNHAANDRDHLREGETLWRSVYEREAISPFIDALTHPALNEDCHRAFQRMAALWLGDFQRVFSLPRIVQCHALPKSRSARQPTIVLVFATKAGIIFVARHNGKDTFRLASFYFPRSLIRGTALFKNYFEHNAVRDVVDTYAQHSGDGRTVLPPRQHTVKRRYEIDRHIRFISAQRWGFESDQPGAVWQGVSVGGASAEKPLDEDVPIDCPIPQGMAEVQHEEDES